MFYEACFVDFAGETNKIVVVGESKEKARQIVKRYTSKTAPISIYYIRRVTESEYMRSADDIYYDDYYDRQIA